MNGQAYFTFVGRTGRLGMLVCPVAHVHMVAGLLARYGYRIETLDEVLW